MSTTAPIANAPITTAATTSSPRLPRDTWNILIRELRPLSRDPFSLIFSLLQPLVFLGLYGPLLVSTSGQPAGETLTWFVPGILVMIALFGTAATGSNLLFEMQTGSHERTLVAPIARSALIIGRALKEMVPIIVQAGVIAVATIPFGFRVSLPGMLIGLVMLAIFGMGFGALSYALALASHGRDWIFWAVQQAAIFPLMILSGMLLPLESGPQWMRAVAAVNPVSYVVSAERALFSGDLTNPVVLWGFVASILLASVGLAIGIRAVRHAK